MIPALVAAAAAALAPAGGSAPSEVVTRSCAQAQGWFYIQIVGDVGWAWRLTETSVLPRRTSVVAVWNDDGPVRDSGVGVLGAISKSGRRFASKCRPARRPAAKTAPLRPAIRVKDGWYYGRKYTCLQQGRVVLEARDLAGGGRRLTVRMQRTGALLAVGEVRGGSAWLRASRSCSEHER